MRLMKIYTNYLRKKRWGEMMTVLELKRILQDWPDYTPDNEPTEVWIETGRMLSSECIRCVLLGSNKDLLLESNAFEEDNSGK